MYILKNEKNQNGAYPPPQDVSFVNTPEGYVRIGYEFIPTFTYYNGFVNLTISDGEVEDMSPDIEAWEEWKSSVTYEPTLDDDRDSMLVDIDYRLTLLELGVIE